MEDFGGRWGRISAEHAQEMSSWTALLFTQIQNSGQAELGVICAEKIEWLWQGIYKPVEYF